MADGEHIVIDGFRQANNGQAVIVFRQECGKVGGSGVGVVAADGVQDVHAVFNQLVGGDFLRVFAFFNQTALDAVFDVGELNAAVADDGAAKFCSNPAFSRMAGVTL